MVPRPRAECSPAGVVPPIVPSHLSQQQAPAPGEAAASDEDVPDLMRRHRNMSLDLRSVQLTSMGFDPALGRRALQRTDSMAAALDLLVAADAGAQVVPLRRADSRAAAEKLISAGEFDKALLVDAQEAVRLTRSQSGSIDLVKAEAALHKHLAHIAFAYEKCAICFDAAACWICVPCGHRCGCADCLRHQTRCPICRDELTTIMDARSIRASGVKY